MRCPTFGNCRYCLRAGPLGMDCTYCPRHYYCCIYTRANGPRENLIDAQRLHARLCYHDHIDKPNVERTFNWEVGDHPSYHLQAMDLLQVLNEIELQNAPDLTPADRLGKVNLAYHRCMMMMDELHMIW